MAGRVLPRRLKSQVIGDRIVCSHGLAAFVLLLRPSVSSLTQIWYGTTTRISSSERRPQGAVRMTALGTRSCGMAGLRTVAGVLSGSRRSSHSYPRPTRLGCQGPGFQRTPAVVPLRSSIEPGGRAIGPKVSFGPPRGFGTRPRPSLLGDCTPCPGGVPASHRPSCRVGPSRLRQDRMLWYLARIPCMAMSGETIWHGWDPFCQMLKVTFVGQEPEGKEVILKDEDKSNRHSLRGCPHDNINLSCVSVGQGGDSREGKGEVWRHHILGLVICHNGWRQVLPGALILGYV